MIVRKRAYARVGFVGNPSDGYYGKTIAFTIGDFWAEVVLYESPMVEIRPGTQDHAVFGSLGALVVDVRRDGYYGGIRLLKAAVKKFAEYCEAHGTKLPEKNFTIQYDTNIPRQVGLGGSSAIITAAMRALMEFFEVDIPPYKLANVVLSAETEELGLTAGLQDRVVQAYEGLVYMDFDKQLLERDGHGRYERLDPHLIPPVYIAYRRDLGEQSDKAHLTVRQRYELGDREVIDTLAEIARLAEEARQLLIDGRTSELARLIDRNFDLRARIFAIGGGNLDMVAAARSTGASCKFCGSGGSVVGTYEGGDMLQRLRDAMTERGYQLILPVVTAETDSCTGG